MNTATIPPVVTATQLHDLLERRPDVRVLDVRSPGEHESTHICGSYNVPVDTLAEHGPEICAHVAQPVVLVCQAGARARKAEATLRAAGMPNLHVLEGGLNAWIAAGHATNRGRERVSLERQVRMVAGGLVALASVLALSLHPLFALGAAAVGSGLVFAGVTDTCMMGMLLARLPYNRPASCDVGAMVAALKAGRPATPGNGGVQGARTVCAS